jgi:serine/threonine protein kinase
MGRVRSTGVNAGPSDPEATLLDPSGGFAAIPNGRLAERYAIVGELGSGSTSRVILAIDSVFGREVAMKVCSSLGENAAERLVREARLTAQIEHSNVVPVFDLDRRPDGTACFTMRRIVGLSLGEMLRRRSRGEHVPDISTVNDLVTIFRKVCDAIGMAHELGLVHQDIKPDNIMVGRHGEVFVVDWGEAVDLRSQTIASSGRISGTPAFMSPEQARAEQVDARSDVYALGASLFLALYDRHPLQPRSDEGANELLLRRARGDLDAPTPAESAAVQLSLQAIVLRALAANPADRFADAEALGYALSEFQSGRVDAWEQLCDLDFTRGDRLDSRFAPLWTIERSLETFSCPERITDHSGRLVIRAHPFRTFLRWSAGISEEARIEVEVARGDGVNLDLCVCGDPLSGYRLRIYGPSFIALETIRSGAYEILERWTGQLHDAPRYRFAIGHADNRIWAELDGKIILECCEPLPPRGSRHRTVAVGRHFGELSCELLALRLWTRRPPLVVGVLEVGKQLLRSGHDEDALAWFHTCMHRDLLPALRHEAIFLAAMAATRGAKLEALRGIAADSGNPFRIQAMHLRAQALAESGDPQAASDELLTAETISPNQAFCGRVASLLIDRLHHRKTDEAGALLTALARIPIQTLDISSTRTTDLTPLAGRPLAVLKAAGNQIADISALAGMPLQTLNLSWNHIRDLTPLRSLPLRDLALQGNPCTSLPTLLTARLYDLNLAETCISDLAPAAGHPLRRLDIHGTSIRDLSPLAGAPLRELNAKRCPLANFTPLESAPLEVLDLSDTLLADPAPVASQALFDLNLCGCPVERLDVLARTSLVRLQIARTLVRSLVPLARLPLQSLSIEGSRVEDLTPLAQMPLTDLSLGASDGDPEWAPLASLSLDNLHVHGLLSPSMVGVAPRMSVRKLQIRLTSNPWAWELIEVLPGLALAGLRPSPTRCRQAGRLWWMG